MTLLRCELVFVSGRLIVWNFLCRMISCKYSLSVQEEVQPKNVKTIALM
jgi:hypothetical protein